MKPDLNELMKQAKQMQDKLKEAQDQILTIKVEGRAAADAVIAIMDGRHNVQEIRISNALLTEDKEIIEATIAAAINDAVRKVEKATNEKMKSLAAGMKLPEGFNLPGSD